MQTPPEWNVAEWYRQAYDIAPIGFCTLDRAGRICELNERTAAMLGFSSSWLLGKSFLVFVAQHEVERFMEFMLQGDHDGEPGEIELDLHVNHRAIPVHITVANLSYGNTLVQRLTMVDLTEFRKKESLLQESLANWHSLVHNAPDTIMTLDAVGKIYFVNKELLAQPPDVLIGANVFDLLSDADKPKVQRCLEESFKYGRRAMCDVMGLGDSSQWYNLSFGAPYRPGIVARGLLTTTTTTTTTTLSLREISYQKHTEQVLRDSGDQLRDLAARLDAIREEERTLVAREIHDELGQALTVLKLDLSWLQAKTGGSAEIRNKLKEAIAQVDATIDSVRRISSELRPPILDDLGLGPALEWQVAQFRKRSGIRTQFVSNADGLQISSAGSAAVFRVVQEALTNVMRHANASRVSIRLRKINGALRISIKDNGKGMTYEQEVDKKSLGIVGMKERIARLGGDFNITSGPGKGTRLDMVIPTEND